MTTETTLRYIASVWLFAVANTADAIGAATRETFGSLGILVKPKRKRAVRPPAPSWLLEHREVEERTWPN